MPEFRFPPSTPEENARLEAEQATESDAEYRDEYCTRREAGCVPHQNLRRFRKSKRLTQDEIAKLLGIGRRTYQQYEDGTRSLTLPAMIKLAIWLDCDLNELVTGEIRPLPLNQRAAIANNAIEGFRLLQHEFHDLSISEVQRRAVGAAAISIGNRDYHYDLSDLSLEVATDLMQQDTYDGDEEAD